MDHPDNKNNSSALRSSALQSDFERAASYSSNSRAQNTLRSYRSDWSHFEAWCEEHSLISLPADPQSVVLYIVHYAEAYKITTLERRLAAISQKHKTSGHDSPALVSREPLHSVWGGIVRSKSRRKDKVAPTLTDDIRLMVEHLERVDPDPKSALTLRSIRDRAILLVGFAGALRRSELASLLVADIQFSADGIKVYIRQSKTDQEGAGQIIGLSYGTNPLTCPVRSMRTWIRTAGINDGPIFRPIDRHDNIGQHAITGRSIARIIKHACLRAGLSPELYSGHSLRAGFATQAARAGTAERIIMNHTRHKSVNMVREYIRDGDLFNDNPTDALGL